MFAYCLNKTETFCCFKNQLSVCYSSLGYQITQIQMEMQLYILCRFVC